MADALIGHKLSGSTDLETVRMILSLGGTQRPSSRRVAEARVKLAGTCGAILSVFCLLVFAAGPAAAAGGVTATTNAATSVSSQSADLNGT
jgi:hypothetical protein